MLKKYSILFFFLALHHLVYADFFEKRLDEIIAVEQYNLDSALVLSQEFFRLAEKDQDSIQMAFGLMRIGSIYESMGRFNEAIAPLIQAYKYRSALKDSVGASSSTYRLGVSYLNKGRADSAFYYYFEGMRLLNSKKNIKIKFDFAVNIAWALIDFDSKKEAREYLQIANEISEVINDIESKAQMASAWGNYYYSVDSLGKAIKYNKNAYLIYEQLEMTQAMASQCNNLALSYNDNKQFELALYYYNIAVDYYKVNELDYQLGIAYYNMGLAYQKIEKLDSSYKYFQLANNLFVVFDDKNMQYESLSSIADVLLIKKNYKEVAPIQHHLILLKDSILNEKKIESIAELKTEYETEQKEQRIAILKAESEKQIANRNFYLTAFICSVLALFFAIFLYKGKVKVAKKNQELAKQKVDNLLNKQEVQTYNALLSGQAKERQRISRDLHDNLGSMLSGLKFQFSALGSRFIKESEDLSASWKQMNGIIDEACVEVRKISHDLNTGVLSTFGLKKAMDDLSSKLTVQNVFNCSFISHGMNERLEQEIEIEIYRISQEILNNCLKHAKAKNVEIQLINRADSLNLSIVDDGVGFDAEKTLLNSKGGIGLQNLKERVEKLGGIFTVESSIGFGTTTWIEIPHSV